MSDELTDEELGLLKAFKRGPGYINISDREGVFALTAFRGLHKKQLIRQRRLLLLNGGVYKRRAKRCLGS